MRCDFLNHCLCGILYAGSSKTNGFTGAMCPCFFTAVYAIMNIVTGVFSHKESGRSDKSGQKSIICPGIYILNF